VPPSQHPAEFTPRALVLGAILGIVFAASSVYLALKIGLTVSASIPIAVLAVAFFRTLGRSTILENNIVQTTGSSGESIAAGIVFTIPAILTLEIAGYGERNLFLIAFLIVITQSSDVLQYLWGKAAGRHLIAPKISPAKTVEGTLGGIACATLLSALAAPMTPFSVAQAALMALAVAVLGFAGGLLLSAIKRSRGIKDWSDLIPGHGGMLDRLDSLVLSAPFFFYAVHFGWAS